MVFSIDKINKISHILQMNGQVRQNKSSINSFFSHPLVQAFLNRILFVKKQNDPSAFFAKGLLYIVLVIFGLSFFDETNFAEDQYGASDSFLHNINLVFHEAGHWIFGFFGRFIRVFGGTLMQCLIPLIVMIQFLKQKDNFSASVGLWWLGQNFLDIAPYIYDAWDRKLILLGGITGQDHPGSHDWYYLLSTTNRLDSYAEIALLTGNLGKFILFLSFVWGGLILYKTSLTLKNQQL